MNIRITYIIDPEGPDLVSFAAGVKSGEDQYTNLLDPENYQGEYTKEDVLLRVTNAAISLLIDVQGGGEHRAPGVLQ